MSIQECLDEMQNRGHNAIKTTQTIKGVAVWTKKE